MTTLILFIMYRPRGFSFGHDVSDRRQIAGKLTNPDQPPILHGPHPIGGSLALKREACQFKRDQ